PAFAPALIREMHAGDPKAAALFAAHFASLYPDNEILTALQAAYQDDTLDSVALTARVQELADRAWENIIRIERLATLQHRLDPRLLALLDAPQEHAAALGQSAQEPAAAEPDVDAGQ